MSYQKQIWREYDDSKTELQNMNDGAVVTPERMNHMETGIDSFHSLVEGLGNEASLNDNGWFKDKKTGLIIQWGSVLNASANQNLWINYPRGFPNRVLNLQATFNYYDANANPIPSRAFISHNNLNQFRLRFNDPTGETPATRNAYWLAIGF